MAKAKDLTEDKKTQTLIQEAVAKALKEQSANFEKQLEEVQNTSKEIQTSSKEQIEALTSSLQEAQEAAKIAESKSVVSNVMASESATRTNSSGNTISVKKARGRNSQTVKMENVATGEIKYFTPLVAKHMVSVINLYDKDGKQQRLKNGGWRLAGASGLSDEAKQVVNG